MGRTFHRLAIVVTVFGLLYRFLLMGAQWWEVRDLNQESRAAAAEQMPDTVEIDGQVLGDGSPLLFQHIYWRPVFSPLNILQALFHASLILGAGALLALASARMAPRDPEQRD